MKGVQPNYIATASEVQTVITEWISATEEFHRYYFQISEVINKLSRKTQSRATVSSSAGVPSRNKVQNLLKLRQHMSDVLTTLLLDMSQPKSAQQRSGSPMSASKPGQLATHTRLIQDINRKVQKELLLLTMPQA